MVCFVPSVGLGIWRLIRPMNSTGVLLNGFLVSRIGFWLCFKKAIAVAGHGALDTVEGAVWRVERNELINPGKGSERRWVVDYLVKYVRPDKVDGCYLPGINSNTEPLWNAQRLIAQGGEGA